MSRRLEIPGPQAAMGATGKKRRRALYGACAVFLTTILIAGYLSFGKNIPDKAVTYHATSPVKDNRRLMSAEVTTVDVNPAIAVSSESPGAPAIVLKGTVVPGYAVFEDEDSRVQKLFKEASNVFDKGVLKAITHTKAYVESGGETYVYRIDGPHISDKGNAAQYPGNGNLSVKAMQPAYGHTPEPFGRRVDKDSWEIKSHAVERVLGRFDSVLQDAKLTLVDTSAGRGFKVSETRLAGVFGQGGIRDNDVILSVNGYDVYQTANWPKLMAMLADERSFSVEIFRNNKNRTFSYLIR